MPDSPNFVQLKQEIAQMSTALGFQAFGVSDIDLGAAEKRLHEWLELRYQGSMQYMSRHGTRRSRPEELVPGTLRVICVRMDYLRAPQREAIDGLDHGSRAYVSRYALGRDYHKVLRSRLARLARLIGERIDGYGFRAFVDSAPVLEKPLAAKAGLGWIGKHTNLISRDAGSWFFLGELYTDLPLPVDEPVSDHCGSCRSCLDVCPTQAIVAPYVVDARRCISYLTIESREAIPVEFRKPMGNRIYGCDDCQLFCPWNKFASLSTEDDFAPRHGLDTADLVDLFGWTEATWLERSAGSAIRRIGYDRWLGNIAIALGNARTSPDVVAALGSRRDYRCGIVREHVGWALAQHGRAAQET